MLNDVAGSIAFSLASPDPFTSITGAQGEPALSEKPQWRTCQFWCSIANPIELHGAGQWAQGTLQDVAPWGHPNEVCFWLFGQRHSHRSFCRARAVLNLFTKQDIGPAEGPSTALSSSPRVTASPGISCSGDCAGRHIKSPCNGTRGCAILEELDNLCNFCASCSQ